MLIVMILTISTACNSQKKSNNNNNAMNESLIVIKETKDVTIYLCNLQRYDDTEYDVMPKLEGENFYLMFDIHTQSKSNTEISTNERYMMRVNKLDDNYKMQLRMESSTSFENGTNVGHAMPSGEWYVNDELTQLVLDYYLSNRESIPVHTENIDISRWNPLFTLYQNSGNQAHVLKLAISELYPETGHFEIDCELVGFSNVLVNGELYSYSISTHTLLFVPMGKEYYVQMKHNSTKTYTNGGKDVTELNVPTQFEESHPAHEVEFSRKVLEYYLEHKSEMEKNMKNR